LVVPLSYGYSLKVKKWQISIKRELREIEVINGKERNSIETLERENKAQNQTIELLQAKLKLLEKSVNGNGKETKIK